MTSHDYMLELLSGWRRKFTADELGMLAEQLKQLVKLAKEDRVGNKFEYLEVYLSRDEYGKIRYLAFDGNSACDGDKSLFNLLNKLGQDKWEYCTLINPDEHTSYSYHLLKRSLP